MKKKVDNIIIALEKQYPNSATQLEYESPFQFLIAVVLSAQCTDWQVNKSTKKLFEKFPNAPMLAEAKESEIEKLIYSVGFFRNKAKNIIKTAKIINESYKQKIPNTLEKLIKLPGVGRKTANLVLSTIFKEDTIVVDTHVKRVAKRLGLTSNTDPFKVECDLGKIIPKKFQNQFGMHLIFLGREFCTARLCRCSSCPVCDFCDYALSS